MYRLALLFGFFAAVPLYGAGAHATESDLPWPSPCWEDRVPPILKGFGSWTTYPDKQVFDLNSLDWHAIARDLNYRRTEEWHEGVWSHAIVYKQLNLFPQDDDFHKRVRVKILRAFDARVEGKILMLLDLTSGSAGDQMILWSAFVEGGPGDKCLTRKYRDRKPAIVSRGLWFYRRGIAVSLRCNDEKRDLLPLAKAIDAKLISCPLVAPEALLSKLPAVEVGQIEPTGREKDDTNRYRAPLKVNAPLDKKTQEIVAIVTSGGERWAQQVHGEGWAGVSGDNHVTIGIAAWRAPYRQGKCILHVGILDRKALVVKWAAPRELPEPEKQGQTAK